MFDPSVRLFVIVHAVQALAVRNEFGLNGLNEIGLDHPEILSKSVGLVRAFDCAGCQGLDLLSVYLLT